MYHLRLKGNHYEMGVKRGRIFQKCNISFPLNLDNFQLKHGKESEKILAAIFPEACEEIHGVCDITGTDYLHFASWLLCMGCCMYNLENNIPVEIRGCTAFAFTKNGRVIYGRNNDLPPYLRDGCKSEIYSPQNGNSFNITTSSFINGEEGLNEHGLAVCMTIHKAHELGGGSIACITNCFTSAAMKQYDCSDGNNYNALTRYNVVLASFQEHIKDNLLENTKNLLKGRYGFMCQYRHNLLVNITRWCVLYKCCFMQVIFNCCIIFLISSTLERIDGRHFLSFISTELLLPLSCQPFCQFCSYPACTKICYKYITHYKNLLDICIMAFYPKPF